MEVDAALRRFVSDVSEGKCRLYAGLSDIVDVNLILEVGTKVFFRIYMDNKSVVVTVMISA